MNNVYLLDAIQLENIDILKRRRDLNFVSDFSNDGKKLHSNNLLIEKLKKLPVRLVVGVCSCKKPTTSPQYDINFCAYCHKRLSEEKSLTSREGN